MIHELLPTGRTSKPVSVGDLARFLGLSRKVIMKNIERERREGWPICYRSGKAPLCGFYLAGTSAEYDQYRRQLHGSILKTAKTRRSLLTIPRDPRRPVPAYMITKEKNFFYSGRK